MKYQRTTRGRPRPNSLLIRQGGSGSASGEGPWTERENRDLAAGGFESPGEEYDLWSKDGVWFGRKAALQNLGQTRHPSIAKDKDVSDEEA